MNRATILLFRRHIQMSTLGGYGTRDVLAELQAEKERAKRRQAEIEREEAERQALLEQLGEWESDDNDTDDSEGED
jgi:hypothetical protein